MDTPRPVVLVALVEAANLRWFVGAIPLDAPFIPLLRSAEGDLGTYRGLGFDDQLSFLRHRLCGVLQRGCDRLWPAGMRARQFVFLFHGELPGTPPDLTQRLADHFVTWILNPPIAVFSMEDEPGAAVPALQLRSGTVAPPFEPVFQAGLPVLLGSTADLSAWEVSQRPPTWKPAVADASEGQPA